MTGVGIDGARSGWVVVRLDGERGSAEVVARLTDALTGGLPETVLIDVPIGLPDTEGSRACDRIARRLLGRRSAAVFNPPVRAALGASDWAEAADLNEAATGKRLSRQSWGISTKIREVDALLVTRPELRGRLREAHPELLFTLLNGGEPLDDGKRSGRGREARIALLEGRFAGVRRLLSTVRAAHPSAAVQPDDVLDAIVLAVVVRDWGDGLVSIPADPPRDARGLPCEMVVPPIASERVAAAAFEG